MVAEYLPAQETLDKRIGNYLLNPENAAAYAEPQPLSRLWKEQFSKKFYGAQYALVYSPLEKRMTLVPPEHPYDSASIYSHSIQYASAMFEGLRLKRADDGTINIILFEPRILNRLPWSLQGRQVELPIPLENYALGIRDMIAVQGNDVMTGPDGQQGEAYIRPIVLAGINGIGIGMNSDTPIIAGAIANYFPSYFLDKKTGIDHSPRIYHGTGLEAISLPVQRLNTPTGKHSSNYADAGVIGNNARKFGDEAVFFGPYKINMDTGQKEGTLLSHCYDVRRDMTKMVVADGSGEEILLGVDKNVYYSPMDTNRLGGTTLEYAKHMARDMGLEMQERPFNFDFAQKMQREGKHVYMFMLGNAVRFAPLGKWQLRDNLGHHFEQIDFKPESDELVQMWLNEFEDQTSGRKPPSHSSLLTPVPQSAYARSVLDQNFAAWK